MPSGKKRKVVQAPSKAARAPGPDTVSSLFEKLLGVYGLERPDFERTPLRAASVYDEIIAQSRPPLQAFPLQGKSGMVLLSDYVAWGLCPHHLLPVRYVFRIGYLPQDKVLGVSKLARLARFTLRDLPLQEDVGRRIVEEISVIISPKGAGCIVHGEHLCMRMRGVNSEQAKITTSFLKGLFLTDAVVRQEFLAL